MVRRRLPRPTDRYADLRTAWTEDGYLGLEVNDHGTLQGLLLRVDGRSLSALARAVEHLRDSPPPADRPRKLAHKKPGRPGKRERLETRPGGVADTDEPPTHRRARRAARR